jgi:IclR family acetate operon transcriptional repressor
MPTADAPTAKDTVKSVRTALRVIEEIAVRQPIGVAELARTIGLPKTTVQRSLVTLSNAEWLQRSADGPTWRLHPRIAGLLERSVSHATLLEAARDPLRRLVAETDESVLLSEPRGDHMLVVDAHDCSQLIRASAPIGSIIPLHASAGGKAFLSVLTEDRLGELLSQQLQGFTAHTLTWKQLIEQLAVVRTEGFAVQSGEWDDSLSSVAAPVIVGGQPVGALVVYGPASRLSQERLRTLGPTVASRAAQISARVGSGISGSGRQRT